MRLARRPLPGLGITGSENSDTNFQDVMSAMTGNNTQPTDPTQ